MTQFIHHLDQLICIFGQPVRVEATMSTAYQPIESEDTFEATITFESGAVVTCQGTLDAPRLEWELGLVGETLTAKLPWSLAASDGKRVRRVMAELETEFEQKQAGSFSRANRRLKRGSGETATCRVHQSIRISHISRRCSMRSTRRSRFRSRLRRHGDQSSCALPFTRRPSCARLLSFRLLPNLRFTKESALTTIEAPAQPSRKTVSDDVPSETKVPRAKAVRPGERLAVYGGTRAVTVKYRERWRQVPWRAVLRIVRRMHEDKNTHDGRARGSFV